MTRKLILDMGFGFQTREPDLSPPYVTDGLVAISAGEPFGLDGNVVTVLMSPDEARLYALKLLKAADKAEEGD